MFRGLKGTVLVLSLVFGAQSSYAIFDAQVLAGKRNSKVSSSGSNESTISGSELKAAAHLSPIPLVPVGFGVTVSSVSYDKDSDDLTFTDFQGLEGALEVSAWLPIDLFNVTPYAKLGYIMFGTYAYDLDATDTVAERKGVYTPKGSTISLGVKWSPLPLVGLLLEYDIRNTKLESDEMKVNGTKITGEDLDNKSQTILVGVEVGI